MLLGITNELADESRIEITADSENKITISTDKGNYDIMGKPFDEFPNTPQLSLKLILQLTVKP